MDPYGGVNKGQPRQSLLPEHTAEVIVVLKCFFSSSFFFLPFWRCDTSTTTHPVTLDAHVSLEAREAVFSLTTEIGRMRI